MKKIGLIGGLGPEATLLYYKGIHNAFKDTYKTTGFPELVIESVDLKRFTEYAEADRWDTIADILVGTCNRLLDSGADFGAICSNTPHRVFEDIQAGTNLSLVSIVEAATGETRLQGLTRIGLLGTGFTMAGNFYQEVFNKRCIDIVMPGTEEQAFIHAKLFEEIEFGIITDETRGAFLTIIDRMTEKDHIQGVLLACTELPLVIRPFDVDIAYLDTTSIHIKAIIERAIEN